MAGVTQPDRDAQLAELIDRLTVEQRCGRTPDPEAVARECPDLAAELRELWAVVQFAHLAGQRGFRGEFAPVPSHSTSRTIPYRTSAQGPPLPRNFGDAVLARAEREGLSHQQFLHLLIAEQANQRRERSIASRIREARFAERQPLAEFDWEFNKSAIDRVQIEDLATGAFIQRQDNLVFVGQSGVGKSYLVQSIAESACVLGYSVRYTTSAALLTDLTKSLADQTLPQRVRYYARFDLLVIDEFAFDRIERTESPQAANLLYKIIDARSRRRSTALVTNIDFDAWGDYLGDPPLAMAFLDRVVDGAIILKINGKSYRAHRGRPSKTNHAPKS